MSLVEFDGNNRLIKINQEIELVYFRRDIYSAWKKWVLQEDNLKYLPAMSSLGRDIILDGVSLGSTFIMENNWKIKPFESDHKLTIIGNLHSKDQSSPFIKTTGGYNVLINIKTFNLIDTISQNGSSTQIDPKEIANAVWSKNVEENYSQGSFGNIMSKHIMTISRFLGLK